MQTRFRKLRDAQFAKCQFGFLDSTKHPYVDRVFDSQSKIRFVTATRCPLWASKRTLDTSSKHENSAF